MTRSVVILAAAVVLSPLAAAQSVDTVDVGGHRLEVAVSGSGFPVVVFEAGLGNDRTTWNAVLPMVSEFTTTVAYTRAGYPGSESGPEPRSPEQIAAELRRLLKGLALPPPYVLVGHDLHSVGGVRDADQSAESLDASTNHKAGIGGMIGLTLR